MSTKISTNNIGSSTSNSIGILTTAKYKTNNLSDCIISSDICYRYNSTEDAYTKLLQSEDISETTMRALLMDDAMNNMDKGMLFNAILKRSKLSEVFIEDFYNSFDKKKLYQRTLSCAFVEKHMDELLHDQELLNIATATASLSIKFIEKYADRLDFSILASNMFINFKYGFIMNNLEKFGHEGLAQLMKNPSVKQSIIIKLLENLSDEYLIYVPWKYVSWSVDLSEELIERYLDFIDFTSYRLCNRTFESETINAFKYLKYRE